MWGGWQEEKGEMEEAWGRRETNGRRYVKEFAGSC